MHFLNREPRSIWFHILIVLVLYGLYMAIFAIVGTIIEAGLGQASGVQTYAYIADIIKVRLYDKIFVHEFLVTNPCDIIQLYTNFLYDYRVDLFRHGFYDDIFGWLSEESSHFVNYDFSFLAQNRLAAKKLIITHLMSLYPQPDGYYYRTFFLAGFEALTGVSFALAIHDGEVWGIFLSETWGHDWALYTGRNPFVPGLTNEIIPISGGSHRVMDLIYYVPVIEDYHGPMALDDRIRVFSLRCGELALTPANPVVIYPKEPPTFS